jgi:hypothetical protein
MPLINIDIVEGAEAILSKGDAATCRWLTMTASISGVVRAWAIATTRRMRIAKTACMPNHIMCARQSSCGSWLACEGVGAVCENIGD